jgi:hypothetical protein
MNPTCSKIRRRPLRVTARNAKSSHHRVWVGPNIDRSSSYCAPCFFSRVPLPCSAPRNTHQPPPPRLLCLLCSAPRGGEDGGPGRWSSPAAAQPPTAPPTATAAPTLRRTVRAARDTLRLCCLSNELSRDGISPPSPVSGCNCIPNPVEL